MNISDYIASGVLEVYVLGELPFQEAAEVEAMAERYPEVREEIQRIEETYESLAGQTAVAPRPTLRDEILGKLVPDDDGSLSETNQTHNKPAKKEENEYRSLWPFQLGIAASLLIAILSAVAALYFRSQWQNTRQELEQVLTQNQEIAAQYETATQQTEYLSERLSVVASPDFQSILLTGTDVSPTSSARVFWNPDKPQLYFNPGSLPAPPPSKQYQLWAIVEGKPVSAGVLDIEEGSASQLLTVQASIQQASAFAITLEPTGGSEAPTMDQMYVQGKVGES